MTEITLLICYVCHRVTDTDKRAVDEPYPGETWRSVPGASHGLCVDCLPLEWARVKAELDEIKGAAA